MDGADIEVDGPGGTVKATTEGEGVYAIPAPWLAKAGDHDLAFTVIANGTVDVLTATLTIPQVPVTDMVAGPWEAFIGSAVAQDIRTRLEQRDTSLWLVAGGAFLAGLFVARLLRRRTPEAAAMALVVVLPMALSSPVGASGPANGSFCRSRA